MTEDDRKRINNANHALVKDWEPTSVFQFFADLAAIPRCSGSVEKVVGYLKAFAGEKGLECSIDPVGNVIIRKPGTRESEAGVILQAHQDMVCVKEHGKDHDFATDPIEFIHKDGWLHANGTTLGADDGIGVALALAVLADPTLPHPSLEALFTVDEETDMKGAKAVRAGSLKGNTLINLDAEDLGIAYVSSAAGVGFMLDMPLTRTCCRGEVLRSVSVSGLTGGHSGLEINKAGGNAYVLLARFLSALGDAGVGYALHSFEQGEGHGADNAVPDRAVALLSFSSGEDANRVDALSGKWTGIFANEYRASDPGVVVASKAVTPADVPGALEGKDRDRLLEIVRLLPLGVWRFIQTAGFLKTPYEDLLVETSCNLGIVRLEERQARMQLLARGSTRSVLDDLMSRIEALAAVAGARVTVVNRTSGWEMVAPPNNVQAAFKAQGNRLLGVHAGLECGCLVEAFEAADRKLDAVAVGPDLKAVHSPDERLHVGSVAALWEQLKAVLATI